MLCIYCMCISMRVVNFKILNCLDVTCEKSRKFYVDILRPY